MPASAPPQHAWRRTAPACPGTRRPASILTALVGAAAVAAVPSAAAGLVGHWPFDVDATDSTGFRDGIPVGATTYAGGTIGSGAALFDGSNYISLGTGIFPTGAYSISAWVYRAPGSAYNIVSGASGHALWAPAPGHTLQGGHNNLWNAVSDTTALPLETWAHVAVTYDPGTGGGTMVLYKDGTEVSDITGLSANADGIAFIGCFNGSNRWIGRIDDVGIWNHALRPGDVAAVHDAGLAGQDLSSVPVLGPPNVSFTVHPTDSGIIPRTPESYGPVGVRFAGTLSGAGFDAVVARVRRGGTPFGPEFYQPLVYAGSTAPFDLSPAIFPELETYDIDLYALAGDDEFPLTSAGDLLAGDIYLINGQSNAEARQWADASNPANVSPFIRSFGSNWTPPSLVASDLAWHIANGDVRQDFGYGGVGQWGIRFARRIVDTHKIPVGILNGAHGGQAISFFQRYDPQPANLGTNYGRLLYRAIAAKVADKVRALVWYQGESDQGNAAGHLSGLNALIADWRQDYPNLGRIYAFQVHAGCAQEGLSPTVWTRNVERLLEDTHADFTCVATTHATAHLGCHYGYGGGYSTLGDALFGVLRRDAYGEVGRLNVESPNPATARWGNTARTRIILEMRDPLDTIVADGGSNGWFSFLSGGAGVPDGVGSITARRNQVTLNLTAAAPSITGVTYNVSASGSGSYPQIRNGSGVGMLTFANLPVGPDRGGMPGATLVPPRAPHPYAPVDLAAVGFDDNGTVTLLEILVGDTVVASGSHTDLVSVSWPAPASGTYSATARVTDDHGNVFTTPATPIDVTASAEAWLQIHFTRAERPDLAGWDADADRDAIPTALEHALGLDPRAPDPPGALPSLTASAEGTITFHFDRPLNHHHVAYFVQTSPDASSWTDTPPASLTVAPSARPGFESVTLTLPNTSPCLLVRLAVTVTLNP